MNATVPTAELQEDANARLLLFAHVPRERRILHVGNKHIDTLGILREMLDNAPTRRGKRYVASAIFVATIARKSCSSWHLTF